MGAHGNGAVALLSQLHRKLQQPLPQLRLAPPPPGPTLFSTPPSFWCRVKGQGTRLRVQGSGFWVKGLGFGVQDLWFRVSGFGFRVSGFGFSLGLGRVQDLGFRVWGSGFRV